MINTVQRQVPFETRRRAICRGVWKWSCETRLAESHRMPHISLGRRMPLNPIKTEVPFESASVWYYVRRVGERHSGAGGAPGLEASIQGRVHRGSEKSSAKEAWWGQAPSEWNECFGAGDVGGSDSTYRREWGAVGGWLVGSLGSRQAPRGDAAMLEDKLPQCRECRWHQMAFEWLLLWSSR